MCAKWREALHEDAQNGIYGTVCTQWRKNKSALCTLNSTMCFYMDSKPFLKIVLHNSNYMCFSFTPNNPKQLQGNSTQCTDKEPRVVSRGRARSNPFQPKSLHYRITMITFWAVCFRHAWIHSPLHTLRTTPSMLHSFGKLWFSIEYSVVPFEHLCFLPNVLHPWTSDSIMGYQSRFSCDE